MFWKPGTAFPASDAEKVTTIEPTEQATKLIVAVTFLIQVDDDLPNQPTKPIKPIKRRAASASTAEDIPKKRRISGKTLQLKVLIL